MMCTTFKYITNGPIRGILKLFFQNFIMHRHGPGTSCTTFSRHNRPGRSDRSAGMATFACANAGRHMHGTDALEDQGPALRLTDLWQAQVGSQRGRPTRVGKLTEKRVRFGRRAPGLTFGTTMTTSSAPVALEAASQKVLAAVPRVPAKHGLAEPPHLGVNRPPSRALTAWTTMVAMRCERGLAYRSPLHARALPNLEGRALKALRSVGLDSGTLDGS